MNYTWRDVAKTQPELVQAYVQVHGPLPDGSIAKEDWEQFWEWLNGQGETSGS